MLKIKGHTYHLNNYVPTYFRTRYFYWGLCGRISYYFECYNARFHGNMKTDLRSKIFTN